MLAGIAASIPMLTACDGTISGIHHTRGTLPALYPEPASSVPSGPHIDEPAQIRAQHMLVMHRDSKAAPPTVVRTKAEARARAEEALQKIKDGADVDEIFSKYSDELGAASRAGDLGKFAKKQMVRKFSEVAFKLKVGEISEIVETEFGYHIIRRTE
jgi:hypothetical protein